MIIVAIVEILSGIYLFKMIERKLFSSSCVAGSTVHKIKLRIKHQIKYKHNIFNEKQMQWFGRMFSFPYALCPFYFYLLFILFRLIKYIAVCVVAETGVVRLFGLRWLRGAAGRKWCGHVQDVPCSRPVFLHRRPRWVLMTFRSPSRQKKPLSESHTTIWRTVVVDAQIRAQILAVKETKTVPQA